MTTKIARGFYEILQIIATMFQQPTVIKVAGGIKINGRISKAKR